MGRRSRHAGLAINPLLQATGYSMFAFVVLELEHTRATAEIKRQILNAGVIGLDLEVLRRNPGGQRRGWLRFRRQERHAGKSLFENCLSPTACCNWPVSHRR